MKQAKKVFLLLYLIISLSIISCSSTTNNKTKQENSAPKPQAPQSSTTIITPQKNYTYNNLQQQIKQLTSKYPTLKASSFGQSLAGQKLYLLKLGTGSKKIAVVAGVHGREGITSQLVLKLIEDYISHQEQQIQNYKLQSILKNTSFYFIPMLNPDGITIVNESWDRLGLKNKNFYITANEGNTNFKRWKANARGVDLNKQFSAHWEKIDSEPKPHFAHYKGSSPESEPESKALADLTREENFAAVLAFHNSGQVIYWYYNQSGQNYQRDYKLAQKLSNATNYKLVAPKDSDKYAAGYKDWFIKEFNQPGFTIEIGQKNGDQPLPAKNLNHYWQKNRTLLLLLAQNI